MAKRICQDLTLSNFTEFTRKNAKKKEKETEKKRKRKKKKKERKKNGKNEKTNIGKLHFLKENKFVETGKCANFFDLRKIFKKRKNSK